MAFFEILALIFKYLLQYSYKNQNIWSRESKITSFTPEISVSFEEGIFGI